MAVLAFVAWVGQRDVPDMHTLESVLCEYFEARHSEGAGPYVGNCVLYGIRMISATMYADLHEARGLLRCWNGGAMHTHWPPVPFPVALVLAVHLMRSGEVAEGLGFMLAFCGLLRVSELCALRVCDVVHPSDGRLWGLGCVLLVLTHTKTGDDLSAELWVQWLWGPLLEWVRRVRGRGGAQARLFPGVTVMRAALQRACTALGLQRCGFVPHSFRGGGALYLLNAGVTLEEVLRRGRWRRPESARPYLQRLRALAIGPDVPVGVLRLGSQWAGDPGAALGGWF